MTPLPAQAGIPSDKERRRNQRIEIALSLIIGVMVGLVVVAFILLTGRLSARMYPPESSGLRRLLTPVIGALVTGYLLFRYFPEARGSGIPQTKFALFIRDGYMSMRSVLGKFLCCSGSLASGIALGREGPSVQIGAGMASVLGRKFGLPPNRIAALIPVGCSAALAAAFNTPIAAVLFSLEEILGDLHAPVLGSVVIASATSWMTLHLILGDEPLFHVPAYQLVSPGEFVIYAVLGVVGGVGSVLFVKLLLAIRTWFKRLPARTAWLYPAAGGLTVGLLGLFMPEVLGVGYDYVERVLGGDMALRTVVILAVLKIIATAMSYSSGNAGGIFGPSLFIGAMIGGAVGSVAHSWFPSWTANPGAYALVGMGTAFAGIVRTPLTSVIMIFEMTRDYSVIVPLMISNLISYFVSSQLQPKPIYEALAEQDGVHLPGAEAREHIERSQVSSVMRNLSLAPATTIGDAARLFKESNVNSLPLTEGGRVIAVIGASQIGKATSMGLASAGDLVAEAGAVQSVYPDQPLSLALERMGAAGVDAMPVVSREDTRTYLGTVTLSEVLQSYGIQSDGAVK
jgi:CIC family chloride channel protein